jgi:hypothetical protein
LSLALQHEVAMTWRDLLLLEPTTPPSLEAEVLSKLQGRLLDFSVDRVGGRLILRGRANSYHVKQLAQCAVLDLSDMPIAANQIEVFGRPSAAKVL